MSNRKQQTRGTSGSSQQIRKQRKAQERRQQTTQNIIYITVGALIIVAALIIPNLFGPEEVPTVRMHPQADDNALGNPDAPVVISEFSDFQCSHCRNFYEETEQLLVNTYVATGQVYFVYRSFGEFISPDSGRAAEAAYCAGDQNKFWGMHDIIFANYGTTLSESFLIDMADTIGLDMDAFDECFASRKYEDRVAQDFEDGQAAGITGTPGFLINGELEIEGNEPWPTIQGKIEAALAESGN